LKGPDEPGHDHDPIGKRRAIEQIDHCFFSILVSGIRSDDVVVVTCDHATPCELGIHSDDKVPLLVSGARFKSDGSKHFDEVTAAKGACPLNKATDILTYVCEVMNHE